MRATSGSVFKAVFVNPLVWIGWVLTYFTLYYEGDKGAGAIFLKVETYRNLAIGAVIYTFIFNRQYTKGRERVDIFETLIAAAEAMYVIFITWAATTALIANYHIGGERYSEELRARYKLESANSKEDNGGGALPEAALGALSNVRIEEGGRYRVTPEADGSFIIEVVEDE